MSSFSGVLSCHFPDVNVKPSGKLLPIAERDEVGHTPSHAYRQYDGCDILVTIVLGQPGRVVISRVELDVAVSLEIRTTKQRSPRRANHHRVN